MDLPNRPEVAYFGLHELYTGYGRMAEALFWLKQFIRDFGDSTTPGTYYLLSRQYQLLGTPDLAGYWYQQADQLLEKLNELVQTINQRDAPRSPEFLEWQALNRVMRGGYIRRGGNEAG